jgi:hypothetical protein
MPSTQYKAAALQTVVQQQWHTSFLLLRLMRLRLP